MLKKSKQIVERIISETKSFESGTQGDGVIVLISEHDDFKGWLEYNGFTQQYIPPRAGRDGCLLNHWWNEEMEIGISIYKKANGVEWVVGDIDGPLCEDQPEVVI